MNSLKKPQILIIDDDLDTRSLIEHFLINNKYEVITAESGTKGLEVLEKSKPDIILLDAMMPGMNGYEVCAKLQESDETAFIPVIFVTALGEEKDKARAISAGAVDYLVKPVQKELLLEKVRLHLKTNVRWNEMKKATCISNVMIMTSDFVQFKDFLSNQVNLPPEVKDKISTISHSDIYSISPEIGITNQKMAQNIANFLNVPYASQIDPEDVELGTLPAPFCRTNHVLAIKENNGDQTFALSNPFDLELIDILDRLKQKGRKLGFVITSPESIESLLKTEEPNDVMETVLDVAMNKDRDKMSKMPEHEIIRKPSEGDIKKSPVVYIANNIIYTAVTERASDIHIEPKKDKTVVRFRVDGDMRDMFTLKKKTGLMLISRLKVIGGMDIAEKHKPQDGTVEAEIENRKFKLRLTTTSTPDGESLIIRLLEPSAKPKSLSKLGMTDEQEMIMEDITNRSHGLILIVGPTGSGKTTTVYSLLSQIDCRVRSLVSIEDPVEYRIPYANQQQVNEKAGVTFEALLKSVVRQDPDIIYMGEIRDQFSAKMSLDFASTGHLSVTTLHTSNATTAIFRLERLGISRVIMADAIICVIAQRLVKKLCPYCKKISKPSSEEIDILSPFSDEVPQQVAHPVGCPKCHNTGYLGREGIYEVLRFDGAIAKMVRSGKSISEIRNFTKKRGEYLISNHAIEKVKKLIFSPRDIYRGVLVEDLKLTKQPPEEKEKSLIVDKKEKQERRSILVVDDDKDIQTLMRAILENQGYKIASALDGVDALLCLSKGDYDLVISDVNMPNLDGFKLLEIINQKGIKTPVIFLTSRSDTEDEVKGFELGAIDYIKKPIRKKILLLRLESFFKKQEKVVQ